MLSCADPQAILNSLGSVKARVRTQALTDLGLLVATARPEIDWGLILDNFTLFLRRQRGDDAHIVHCIQLFHSILEIVCLHQPFILTFELVDFVSTRMSIAGPIGIVACKSLLTMVKTPSFREHLQRAEWERIVNISIDHLLAEAKDDENILQRCDVRPNTGRFSSILAHLIAGAPETLLYFHAEGLLKSIQTYICTYSIENDSFGLLISAAAYILVTLSVDLPIVAMGFFNLSVSRLVSLWEIPKLKHMVSNVLRYFQKISSRIFVQFQTVHDISCRNFALFIARMEKLAFAYIKNYPVSHMIYPPTVNHEMANNEEYSILNLISLVSSVRLRLDNLQNNCLFSREDVNPSKRQKVYSDSLLVHLLKGDQQMIHSARHIYALLLTIDPGIHKLIPGMFLEFLTWFKHPDENINDLASICLEPYAKNEQMMQQIISCAASRLQTATKWNFLKLVGTVSKLNNKISNSQLLQFLKLMLAAPPLKIASHWSSLFIQLYEKLAPFDKVFHDEILMFLRNRFLDLKTGDHTSFLDLLFPGEGIVVELAYSREFESGNLRIHQAISKFLGGNGYEAINSVFTQKSKPLETPLIAYCTQLDFQLESKNIVHLFLKLMIMHRLNLTCEELEVELISQMKSGLDCEDCKVICAIILKTRKNSQCIQLSVSLSRIIVTYIRLYVDLGKHVDLKKSKFNIFEVASYTEPIDKAKLFDNNVMTSALGILLAVDKEEMVQDVQKFVLNSFSTTPTEAGLMLLSELFSAISCEFHEGNSVLISSRFRRFYVAGNLRLYGDIYS